MAFNTHALRFVANRKMWVSLGSKAREKCSVRGIDQFTFDAHIKVGAGAINLNQRAYVETHASREKIRFACTPTRDNGRSVLIFEFARSSSSSPTSYRYELPNGWDDRWHHVAFSVSTGDGKYAMYFDDTKVKEGKIVGYGLDTYNRPLLIDEKTPKEITIGACPTGSSGYTYWDGKIDNVRLLRKFVNGNTYSSTDTPVDDHASKVGAFAVDINLIEEWRFNEGPRGSAKGMTYGVVDHQYDPKLKFDEYQEQDNPPDNTGNNQQDDFDPGPPEIADATLYEDGSVSNNLWIGIDVSEDIRSTQGIVVLPRDSDRPFLGDGLSDTSVPSMPTDLATTAITEDSFEVSWRQASDNVFVHDYQVDVSTFNNFSSLIYTRRTNQRTTERVVGLVPGQRYYWRVRAIDAAGNESAWASSTAYTPFKLRSTSRVNYSPNPSFEGLRDLTAWEPAAVSGTLPNLSVKDYVSPDVRPDDDNQIYGNNYLVVQSNGGIAGIYRGAAHFFDWKPNKEMRVSFWARGDAEFGVYYYSMQYTKITEVSTLMSLKEESTNTTATIRPLTNTWKKYSFTATPTNSALNQIQMLFVNTTSAEFSFEIEGLIIESENPTGLYFDGSHKGTLPGTAYWAVFNRDQTATRDGYLVGPAVGSTLSTTDETISVYDVEVYPTDILQTLDFVDRTAPNPPITATVTHTNEDIGESSFTVKWKAPEENFEDIVAYDLQIGLRSNMSARDAVFVPGYSGLRLYDAVLNNGIYTKVVSNLAPETTYYYRVRAVDSNGNFSEWSLTKAITTDAYLDEIAPSEVILQEPTEITFEGFTANWSEAIDDVGVAGYRLTLARDAGLTQIVSGFNGLDVGNALQYRVLGLQEQSIYYYGVTAYDTAGNESDLTSSMFVETLVRPEEFGGLVSQRLGLESFVKVSTSSSTTNYGEGEIVALDPNTEILIQTNLNRTVPRGEVKSAVLNISRLTTNNPAVTYQITKLAYPSGSADGPFYDPEVVTDATKPTTVGDTKEIYIEQAVPAEGHSIISLDVSDMIEQSDKFYGFKIKAIPATSPSTFSMEIAGTQNPDLTKRPEFSFVIDTSKDYNITAADVRVTSQPTIVRNLFPNPTFDMTAGEFPLPNHTFQLNDTRYWEVVGENMVTNFALDNLSYDGVGGSGSLEISQNFAQSGALGAVVLHQYRIPVIKDKTYTARAYLSTTSSSLRPRIAIYRYDKDGALLDNGRVVDLSAWSPTANIWYQRTISYQVSSTDQDTAWLQVAVVVQSIGVDASGNGPTGSIKIDSVSISSNAQDTPLFVEPLANASALKTTTKSFDAGYDANGVALEVKTKPTTEAAEAGAGVRLVADIPSAESWLTKGLSQATINLVENPSFESSSLSHVTGIGSGTDFVSEPVNGARGTRALHVTASASSSGIIIDSVNLPSYAGTFEKTFVGSLWVLGGYTYSVKLSLVYADGSKVIGTAREFTPVAGSWTRLTLAGSDAISVTGDTIKSGSNLQRIELQVDATTTNADMDWYIDGVQIEERVNATAGPTAYCDGSLDDCHWYGEPHASISFRNAFVGSFRLYVNTQEATNTNLLTKLRITPKIGSPAESPVIAVGTLPAATGWLPIRTWPMVAIGASPDFPPVRADLNIYADGAIDNTFTIDAVSLVYDDPAFTYFNGSTLKGSWRQLPFSSLSEYQGVEVNARVFTSGNLYSRGVIRSWFRPESKQTLGFTEDDGITVRYERDSRYSDVKIPDRIRWNEIDNPSFEINASGWSVSGSTIANRLSATAKDGGSVGVWKLTGNSPLASNLQTAGLAPVAGQLWTANAHVRAPLISRATPVKFQVSLQFYNASGVTFTNSKYTEEVTLTNKTAWTLVQVSAVAPPEAKWVRMIFENVEVSPSFGLLINEELEIDACMLYRGDGGRAYADGDDSNLIRWEGRRHASPSIFTFNGGDFYTFKFSADDGEGTLLGDAIERTVQTELESTDFIEFRFDRHRRNVTSRSIELVIPYLGDGERDVALTGTYRRVDSFERFPLLVEFNQTRGEVYVRADDLAQNREYVLEMEAVAPDLSKLRGERSYTTRVASSVRDDVMNTTTGDGSIKFDGFALSGPDSKYYWVTEHDSFSLPDRRTQIETIPRMDGGVELKAYWGTKKISLSGGVWGNNRAELYDNVNALRSALAVPRGKLQINTLARSGDYYKATCTQFSTKEVAGENLNNLQWDATFECSDPFLYRGEEQVSSFTIVSSKPNNVVDTLYTEDQKFTILNSGTVNSIPKISLSVVKGAGEYAVSFVNETTGQRLMPKAVLTRNDIITANSKDQSVYKNEKLTLDYVGSFIELRPGVNIIRASIKDLKSSRHNLLGNPGVEKGPASFDNIDTDGIRPAYKFDASGNKTAVGGVLVTRNRFQTATSSDYAALVECDGEQERQGVVFNTITGLSSRPLAEDRFVSRPTDRRTFSASAYVRADSTNNRQVVLDRCFIRIWYMDGTREDQESNATTKYSLNTQWKLIQLPKITSQEKAINYVEVLLLFANALGSKTSFYVDNALLTQEDLAADQIDAEFQLTVAHNERFI